MQLLTSKKSSSAVFLFFLFFFYSVNFIQHCEASVPYVHWSTSVMLCPRAHLQRDMIVQVLSKLLIANNNRGDTNGRREGEIGRK